MTKEELRIKKHRTNISLQLPENILKELNAITIDIGASRNGWIVKAIIKQISYANT